jgi:hypothetical protein
MQPLEERISTERPARLATLPPAARPRLNPQVVFKIETRSNIPKALNHEVIVRHPLAVKFPHPNELPEDIGQNPPMKIVNPPLSFPAVGTVRKRHRKEPANVHPEEINKALDILRRRPRPLPLSRCSVAVNFI